MEYDDFGRTTKTSIASTAKTEYNYTKGNLASILRTDDAAAVAQRYNFTYDSFGNMTAAKVGNVTLASYTYAPNNGDLLTQTYANGDSVNYTYDLLGQMKTASTSDGRTLTYRYSGDGQLSQVTETQDGKTATYVYNYDSIGRLISMRKKVDGDTVLLMGSRYNSKNQLIRNSWRVGAAVFSQDYTYNSLDGSINTVTMPDQQTLTMGYDSLRRLSTVTGGVTAKRYLYRTFEDNTTTDQVTSLSYTGLSKVFQYSYDVRGNIATYAAPGKSTVTYTYDKQGQLLSASNGYSYTYDNVGNILTATKNGTTHTYTYSTYDWKDKLISYDGQAIAYDASGNPTSYYNGTRWNMTWENGRELSTATSGNTNLSFTYDGEGVRTSKTVNGVEHKYYYSGGKLLRETYSGNILDFAYNADGTLYSLRVNGTYYYYVTNLQGDVIAIVDKDKNVVASYEYDPYGGIAEKSGTLADINPMRYRGYVYDTETGFYYVSSRYYDPEIGRWINADDTAYLGADGTPLSYNLFTYCKNNPVMLSDHNGHAPEWWQWAISGAMVVAGVALVATGVGGVAGGALICAGANSMIGSYVSEATGCSSVAGWVGGMITGAACGTGAGLAGNLLVQATNATGAACLGNLAAGGAVAFGSGTVGSAIGQSVSAAIDGKKLNSKEVVYASTATGAINCLSGLGAGIGTALQGMPAISTTTTTLANSLNAAWSLVSESVCDFLGTISSLLPW